ncbi:heavy metal-binding domain-containing protein, partial [uncultured Meiothermus sp.]|uniref:heavy metal-binding domain-containing protein n=1 Tax=uncultured Meiothermus sp. TaxID=157471 RepID=UPI002617FD27
MVLTTSSDLEGYQITEYLDVVFGEAILGANIFRDLLASVRDIVGGRSGAYEAELRKAREIALNELEQAAMTRGADAVIAVDIDYETVGQG